MTKQGVIMNDTDPYYRLHRIDVMLNENKIYPLFDKQLDSPQGVNVSWPLGLDLLIALPLKLYNSKSHTEIESFGAIIIPVLSLPLLWCIGWIGTTLVSPLVGLLLGLIVSLSPTLVYQTGIGRLDHHFIEAMLPIVLLMFTLRFNEKRRMYDMGWMIMILGLSPSFNAHEWILAPLLVLGFLFDRKWHLAKSYSRIFFAAAILSVIPLSFSNRFQMGYVAWVSFSWWATWIYLSCGVGFQILDRLVRKNRSRLDSYEIALLVIFIGISSFLTYTSSYMFIQSNLISSVQVATAKVGTMATTLEAKSPFQMEWSLWKNFDFHILAIGLLCFFALMHQRKYFFILGFSIIPFYLGFLQIRFLAMGMSLMILITILFLHLWISKIQIKEIWKKVLLTSICVFLILPFKPILGFSQIGNTHSYFYAVRKFCFFLNNEFKIRNVTKKDQAIIAHWDYGHWLLYYTGLPVVADPFQGPSAMEVLELFTSKGTDQLDQFIKKHPAQFLIIESGAKRSLNWLETTGKTRDTYFEKTAEIAGQEYFKTKPEFDDLFMYRYFFELGRGLDNNHPEHWRLIYISPYPSPQENDISALKVYEHVPGLNLQVTTKTQDTELYLQAEIYERNEGLIFQQVTKGMGKFNWIVPYGEYARGGVKFDGSYTIRNKDGKILRRIHHVTEDMILKGETLKIQL